MFLGEFTYKIDEKGRIPIPPKFRVELKGGVVLAPGPEKCIAAYPVAGWRKMADSLTSGAVSPSKARRMARAIFATAFTLEIDAQGRVALPVPLREYAGISDEVVVAGVNNYIELWERGRWEEEKAVSQEQVWQILETIERR